MSHVFVPAAERQWSAVSLEPESVELLSLFSRLLAGAVPGGSLSPHMIVFGAGEGERWAVLTAPATRLSVNGMPMEAIGIRVLSHQDEITVAGAGSVFFSAERLAVVAPLPDAGRAVYCGRCRQEIKPGSPAVKCPGCGVWHDQSDDLGCWTFCETCSCCQTRTALNAGLAWVPEE